jgi:hypothetical protein
MPRKLHTLPNQTKTKPNNNPPYIPPDEIKEEWAAYVELRKKLKKPLTDYAAKLSLAKLDKMAHGDYERQRKILNQSIMNGWQGLFELKDGYSNAGANSYKSGTPNKLNAQGGTSQAKGDTGEWL